MDAGVPRRNDRARRGLGAHDDHRRLAAGEVAAAQLAHEGQALQLRSADFGEDQPRLEHAARGERPRVGAFDLDLLRAGALQEFAQQLGRGRLGSTISTRSSQGSSRRASRASVKIIAATQRSRVSAEIWRTERKRGLDTTLRAQPSNGSRITMMSSRSGPVVTSTTGAPISSSMRRT